MKVKKTDKHRVGSDLNSLFPESNYLKAMLFSKTLCLWRVCFQVKWKLWSASPMERYPFEWSSLWSGSPMEWSPLWSGLPTLLKEILCSCEYTRSFLTHVTNLLPIKVKCFNMWLVLCHHCCIEKTSFGFSKNIYNVYIFTIWRPCRPWYLMNSFNRVLSYHSICRCSFGSRSNYFLLLWKLMNESM